MVWIFVSSGGLGFGCVCFFLDYICIWLVLLLRCALVSLYIGVLSLGCM